MTWIIRKRVEFKSPTCDFKIGDKVKVKIGDPPGLRLGTIKYIGLKEHAYLILLDFNKKSYVFNSQEIELVNE